MGTEVETQPGESIITVAKRLVKESRERNASVYAVHEGIVLDCPLGRSAMDIIAEYSERKTRKDRVLKTQWTENGREVMDGSLAKIEDLFDDMFKGCKAGQA